MAINISAQYNGGLLPDIISPNEQRARGWGMLPDFLFFIFFPVQQTTSGIGHQVK